MGFLPRKHAFFPRLMDVDFALNDSGWKWKRIDMEMRGPRLFGGGLGDKHYHYQRSRRGRRSNYHCFETYCTGNRLLYSTQALREQKKNHSPGCQTLSPEHASKLFTSCPAHATRHATPPPIPNHLNSPAFNFFLLLPSHSQIRIAGCKWLISCTIFFFS